MIAKGKKKAGGVQRALGHGMIRGRVFTLEKVHGAFIRRFVHGLDHDLLHVDVPLGGGAVGKKTLNDTLLFELMNGVRSKLSVEKETLQ